MAFPIWAIPLIMQAGSTVAGIASQSGKRKTPAAPMDQFAGLLPQANEGMRQQLTGRPDPTLMRAQSAAVRAPFLAAEKTASRGVGFSPGSNMRQKFLSGQASAVAAARAKSFQGAAQGKRSALQQIIGQRPSDLERMMRYNIHRAGLPGQKEQTLAAGAEGAGDIGKLALLMQMLGEGDGGGSGGGWGGRGDGMNLERNRGYGRGFQ